MDLGLANRACLVTGGSRGIGRAIAEALAGEGAYVAVTYRDGEQRARAVADAINEAGGRAMVTTLDLGSPASITAAVNRVLDRWGRLDVLINNAVQWSSSRISDAPPFEALPPEEWRPLLRHNIEGVYLATQAALPAMRSQRWGRIVNVTAVAAVDGMRGGAWYTTAKAAIHGLTRSLAREVASDGILVNAVMPGLTLTDHTRRVLPEPVRDECARSIPIGRLLVPRDIATVAVFLASAANTAISGEFIRASGGSALPYRSAEKAAPQDQVGTAPDGAPDADSPAVPARRS